MSHVHVDYWSNQYVFFFVKNSLKFPMIGMGLKAMVKLWRENISRIFGIL